jgi:hypothetical protein
MYDVGNPDRCWRIWLAFDRDGDDGPWNLVTVNTVAGPGTGDPITVPEQPPKSIRMWH